MSSWSALGSDQRACRTRSVTDSGRAGGSIESGSPRPGVAHTSSDETASTMDLKNCPTLDEGGLRRVVDSGAPPRGEEEVGCCAAGLRWSEPAILTLEDSLPRPQVLEKEEEGEGTGGPPEASRSLARGDGGRCCCWPGAAIALGLLRELGDVPPEAGPDS